jgi:AcrR family transcriptional regulator
MTDRRPRVPTAPQDRGTAFVGKVFAAVIDVLGDVGYDGLTVPDVADRAGVNKTSIYRRWPDKAALVKDALHTLLEVNAVLPQTGSLSGDLTALLRVLGAALSSPFGRAALRLLWLERHSRRDVVAGLGDMGERLIPRQVFVDARARGEIDEGVDADLVLFALAGALLHRTFVENADVDDAFIDRLVKLVLFGVAQHPR